MGADPILLALAADVPAMPLRRVVIGLNWTWVETGTGACGLAHSPPRDRPGCAPPAGAGTLADRSLRDLAMMAESGNPVGVALAIAAVNAAYPAPDGTVEGNGLDMFTDIAARTVVAGRFPRIEEKLPGCAVIEREPGPGDHAEDDAPALLASAQGLIITASALGNGGVSRYLALTGPAVLTALVGPGTPFAPALHRAGLRLLAGVKVIDPEGVARVVMEGGAVKAMAPFVRTVVLRG